MLITWLPAECQASLACCKCPAFRLPWSSPAQNPPANNGSSQAYSPDVSAQRLKEAGTLAWNARIVWIVIHGTLIGAVFMFDTPLSRSLEQGDYWFLGSYGFLLIVTVIQYYFTSGSSPGYVQEIMEATEGLREPSEESLASQNGFSTSFRQEEDFQVNVSLGDTSETPLLANSESSGPSTEEIPVLTKSRSFHEKISNFIQWHNQRQIVRPSSDLLKRTPSNRRCPYCQVWQPMRTKHCHDCDKCVLRFDHHCFWVGTCIGQRNHCRFWWYLFYESLLVCWTCLISLYAFAWEDRLDLWILHNILAFSLAFVLFVAAAFLVILLGFHTYLVLTNQTTYETTRRNRISYLRHVPAKIHPFSKGLWENIYSFCCTPSSVYPYYELPPMSEMERREENYKLCSPEYFQCCPEAF